jgi:hypothetical protein
MVVVPRLDAGYTTMTDLLDATTGIVQAAKHPSVWHCSTVLLRRCLYKRHAALQLTDILRNPNDGGASRQHRLSRWTNPAAVWGMCTKDTECAELVIT